MHSDSISPVYLDQERFLPLANISRIMRNTLPANCKVSKGAKQSMQECLSEFISFISSEALEKCTREKRKTISGEDILYSFAVLGFDLYVNPLKLYCHQLKSVYCTQ